MPSYSRTNADLSREVRVENYDGTATVTVTPAGGSPVVTTVSSDEQPPPPDPVAALLAELPAATLEETNDLLVQILDLIGGN
jgi:hypothetical protein